MLSLHCKDRKFSPSFDFIPYTGDRSIIRTDYLRIKGRSIFPYVFLNLNNVKIRVGGWVRKKGLLELKNEWSLGCPS